MQIAMYLFLLAMPIVGWRLLSSEGNTVPFFGIELPPLADPDASLREPLEEAHESRRSDIS